MNNIYLQIRTFAQGLAYREEGQDLVEYALLGSLVALAVIAATQNVATAITSIFNKISTTIT